jgi:hypothetical protein
MFRHWVISIVGFNPAFLSPPPWLIVTVGLELKLEREADVLNALPGKDIWSDYIL